MTDPERIALFCIDEELEFQRTLHKHYSEEQKKAVKTSDVISYGYSVSRVGACINLLERIKKNTILRFELFKKNPDNTHIIPPDYNPSNFKGSNT